METCDAFMASIEMRAERYADTCGELVSNQTLIQRWKESMGISKTRKWDIPQKVGAEGVSSRDSICGRDEGDIA